MNNLNYHLLKKSLGMGIHNWTSQGKQKEIIGDPREIKRKQVVTKIFIGFMDKILGFK